MTVSGLFFLALAVVMGGLFLWARGRGDVTGWWLGLGHAALALVAIAGWSAARDDGFAVAMALLAVYGGAMAATEIIRRVRHPNSAV